MVALLLYAHTVGIYSSGRIAKACRERVESRPTAVHGQHRRYRQAGRTVEFNPISGLERPTFAAMHRLTCYTSLVILALG
jgi:hypothetical protein